MEDTIICNRCGIEKSYNDFHKHPLTKTGRLGYCKACKNAYMKLRSDNNPEVNIRSKERYYKNHEKSKERYRNQYLKHRDKKIKKACEYNKRRLKTDPLFKLKATLRSRILTALKNNKKSDLTMRLTGCSLENLRSHIEKQFKEGMSWDNHGIKGWHIDHIIPCKYFDLSDPEQQKKCFHYSNLQPLWWWENLRKGARI